MTDSTDSRLQSIDRVTLTLLHQSRLLFELPCGLTTPRCLSMVELPGRLAPVVGWMNRGYHD